MIQTEVKRKYADWDLTCCFGSVHLDWYTIQFNREFYLNITCLLCVQALLNNCIQNWDLTVRRKTIIMHCDGSKYGKKKLKNTSMCIKGLKMKQLLYCSSFYLKDPRTRGETSPLLCICLPRQEHRLKIYDAWGMPEKRSAFIGATFPTVAI